MFGGDIFLEPWDIINLDAPKWRNTGNDCKHPKQMIDGNCHFSTWSTILVHRSILICEFKYNYNTIYIVSPEIIQNHHICPTFMIHTSVFSTDTIWWSRSSIWARELTRIGRLAIGSNQWHLPGNWAPNSWRLGKLSHPPPKARDKSFFLRNKKD